MAFGTVAGYTYRAEMLCLDCVAEPVVALFRRAGGQVPSMSPEINLDAAALYLGVDRSDERTFDSEDFPKVVLDVQVEDGERCDGCGEDLS